MAEASDSSLLDNPIWSSLVSRHASFATGGALARQYRREIGPLAGMREPSSEALAELAQIIPAGDAAVLFLENQISFPAEWQIVLDATMVQMICPSPPAEVPTSEEILGLGPQDYPEMVELAKLTEPGPFRSETGTLGHFVGIRVGQRLAAMAGQRLSPTGFVEVSAVCTHPDFRGRGFARALVAQVARNIFARGDRAFLSALKSNSAAIRVYEQVGFRLRREMQVTVVRPPNRA